jgi:hypothetical protein
VSALWQRTLVVQQRDLRRFYGNAFVIEATQRHLALLLFLLYLDCGYPCCCFSAKKPDLGKEKEGKKREMGLYGPGGRG